MGVLFFKNYLSIQNSITTKKVSKYGVFSGPYFPVFGRNTGKYGPEKTPYLDTFYAELRETIFFFFYVVVHFLISQK